MKSYTIVKELIPMFEEKLDKFAKKFSKYGSYTYNKSEPYVCDDEDSRWYKYTVVDIELDASYKVGDYSFVASLEWVDDANENLIKKASEDVYVPPIYKSRRMCDHCHTSRNRVHTIILKNNESGEYVQVGKSCVRDYIGVDLGNYASFLSFFDSIDEFLEMTEFKGQTHWKKNYTVREILEQACEEANKNGYISKSVAIDNDVDSTSQRVFYAIMGITNLDGKLLYELHKVDEHTNEMVRDVYNFFENLDSDNDYINNLKTLLKVEYVQADKLGMVVSMVGTKLRIENENRERELRTPSEYIGSVGDKITFRAIPKCIYSTPSQFGYFYIYKMISNNNVIVWNTSKNLEEDVELEFVATVKEHSVYRGEKQTEITRARTKKVN